MSTIKTSFADFFTAATVLLTNAQANSQVAVALDGFGYDAAAIQQGQALLTTARTLYDEQIKAYGEQRAATQAFLDAFKEADKSYIVTRNLARIVFKKDAHRQTDLLLNKRKAKAFNAWYQQANHFYTALLADTAAQSQLARYKIILTTLQTGQAQAERAVALKSTQEREKGEAQHATQQRDEAIAALDNWVSDLRACFLNR